jgi:hypothetical protein
MKIEDLMKYSYSLPGVVKSSSAFSRPTFFRNKVAKMLSSIGGQAAPYYMDDAIVEIERLQTMVDDLETRINELTKDQ